MSLIMCQKCHTWSEPGKIRRVCLRCSKKKQLAKPESRKPESTQPPLTREDVYRRVEEELPLSRDDVDSDAAGSFFSGGDYFGGGDE